MRERGAPRRLSRLKRSATSRRATCGALTYFGDTRYGKRKRNATRNGSSRRHFDASLLRIRPRDNRPKSLSLSPSSSSSSRVEKIPCHAAPNCLLSSISYRMISRCNRIHTTFNRTCERGREEDGLFASVENEWRGGKKKKVTEGEKRKGANW